MAFDAKPIAIRLLKKVWTMLRLFVGSVIFTAAFDGKGVYDAITNGSTQRDGNTVHVVLQHLTPALELGAIAGALSGVMAITIWSLGTPMWAILSPFLGNATALLGNMAGSYSGARSKKKNGGSDTS
jgi:hypothetical protein